MSAKFLRAALVTTLALAGLPLAAPFAAPASAQGIELRIGPDGVRPVIRDRDLDRRDRRDRGCSPREAERAAAQEGLRRAEVVRVTDRSITVRGFTRRGGPEQLRFANRRGCPLI